MDKKNGFGTVSPIREEEKEQYRSKMLTRDELAAMWRVCVHTIDNYRRKLGLPYVKIGASVRFSLRDVTRWLRKREIEYFLKGEYPNSDF